MRPPTTLKGQMPTLPLKQNSLGWLPLWSGGKGNVSQASHLSVLFQYPYSVEMNFKGMTWDPKIGFVIPSHSFVYSGVLTCTANVNGSVFTSYYLAQRLGEWLLCAEEWPQCFYFLAKPLGIISWLASIIFDISIWYVSVTSPSWNAKSKLILLLFSCSIELGFGPLLVLKNYQALRWYKIGVLFYSNPTKVLFAWIELYLH